jgi:diacylglycerol kinase (ATP)
VHHLIVNPVAGGGRGLPLVERVVGELRAAGLEVVVHRTQGRGDARRIVGTLEDGAVAVAMGGDGTIHEVAAGCLERDLLLGLIPVGSGDDFAFALRFERHDLAAAIRVLLGGFERRVDVGTLAINDDGASLGDARTVEPFVNGFGTGFDADVARRIEHAPRIYRGLGKYLYGVVTAMRDFKVLEATLELDGREAYRGPALLVAIQNGPRAGGSFMFSPDAEPDDGLLDVLVATRFGRLGTLRILPTVMRGRHLNHPKILFFQARRASVRWSAPVTVHTDGEVLGLRRDFEVGVRPRVLRVIAPRT